MSTSLSSGLTGMIEGTKNFRQVLQSLAQSVVRNSSRWASMSSLMGRSNWRWPRFRFRGNPEDRGGGGGRCGADRGFSRGGGGGRSVDLRLLAQKHNRFGVGGVCRCLRLPGAGDGAGGRRSRRGRARRGPVGGRLRHWRWSIPQDQLAIVHQNELIMPAAEAGPSAPFRAIRQAAAARAREAAATPCPSERQRDGFRFCEELARG